jgi:hypothetical protein
LDIRSYVRLLVGNWGGIKLEALKCVLPYLPPPPSPLTSKFPFSELTLK